ncbi:MerR family transcriptional regulator [Streptomyces sp. NPDC057307]|uniref:MerR family transcriptional regulator n=1 Tax=Streptomyces sp. NPDC057307 TaxID=3346096 RepID=UPI00363070B3
MGELAHATGTTTRAPRYYEEQGLLRPVRAANGCRAYGDDAVRVVENIRPLLVAGLTTEDLLLIDGCLRDELVGEHACADSTPKAELFEQRLALIQRRINDLAGVRDQLRDRLAEVTSPRERHATCGLHLGWAMCNSGVARSHVASNGGDEGVSP